MIKNKKGDEKILSIWMFFIWIIIGMAIVAGVYLYYGSPQDVREIQSKILADKIAECILINSQLDKNYLNSNFDLVSYCKINTEMISNGKIYFNVSVVDRTSGILLRENIIRGDSNFQVMCSLNANKNSQNIAKCASETYSGIYEDKDILIVINTGSNNLGS
ncbi:MAG: hypothetical protein WC781_02910 [Candidatus Pacearchaeota archaeon]|jgi:hypothetical protein